MGPERWDSISPEVAKRGPQLELPIDPRELAVEAYFAKHSVGRVASIGDATRRTEVSVGVHPSFAQLAFNCGRDHDFGLVLCFHRGLLSLAVAP